MRDDLGAPLVWDLAHIGNYEELWLLRAIDGRPPVDASLDDLYNAFEHPRWERPSLPILGPTEARDYVARVRDDVLTLLDRVDLGSTGNPLLDGGFVYGMVAQHEHQHDETMLATHQLRLDAGSGVPGATPARLGSCSRVHTTVPSPWMSGDESLSWNSKRMAVPTGNGSLVRMKMPPWLTSTEYRSMN